jgi:hypothetical protein
MAGYTKEFLVDVYLSRFMNCSQVTPDQLEVLEHNANRFYDEVGRDKFRTYASVDAEAIKLYKSCI